MGIVNEYLYQKGIITLEQLVGQNLYFVFPRQGVVEKRVKKIQYTETTKEWWIETNALYLLSDVGKSIFLTENEAIAYQHKIMDLFTKEQQEKIIQKEKLKKEKDLNQLGILLMKYSDYITVKVEHYISTNLNTGVIWHREDNGDVTDIENVKINDNGSIEISICVTD